MSDTPFWFAAIRREARQSRTRLRIAAKRLLVLALFLTGSPVQAQWHVPMTFGDIEITLQSTPQGNSWHGYCEYAFRVRNLSDEQPHTVGLSIPSERGFNRGDTIRDLRRTVQVGPNETVHLSLLQPDHPPIDGSNVAVFIDGQRRQREAPLRLHESNSGFRFRRGRFSRSLGPVAPLLLISSRVSPLPVQTGGMPAGMPGGMGGMAAGGAGTPVGGAGAGGAMMAPPGGPPAFAPEDPSMPPMDFPVPGWGSASAMLLAWLMGEVEYDPGKPGLAPNSHQPVNPEPVETWSNNWLAYSRYDGVLIKADELKTMPAGVRAALWQYVETGGFLFVIGPADLKGLSAVTRTSRDSDGWTTIHAGFGRCLISPNSRYETWDAKHFDRLSKEWNTSASTWIGGQRNTTDANHRFPIIEDLGIPSKGLFVLMFLFALGIGPINLLILTRLKRRIWLLWTTPLISLATCVTVFGFMLISEGWEGQLRTETLTLLDETTHRATTIGWTGVYTPLTPGDGLHFSYDTEVIPQRYFDDELGAAHFCTIDWSQDQHLASGWVEARVPAHFKVRKSELRRERVPVHREADGRWSMVNGIGESIRRFWYADEKGQVYAAEDIAPGARALLTRTERESQVETRDVWDLSSNLSWIGLIQSLATYPERYLRPGNYLVEVDDSPFLENALRSAKQRKTHGLIVGFRNRNEE
jgi:hypothetical protein